MRNLIEIINEMLLAIPSKEDSLIRFMKSVQKSQHFRAPEDMTGWYLIAEKLNSFKFNKETPLWKLQLCSIFSMKNLEEIKKEVYGN